MSHVANSTVAAVTFKSLGLLRITAVEGSHCCDNVTKCSIDKCIANVHNNRG